MQLVVGLVLLCSLASLSRGCCTPDQWEGYQMSFSGYASIFHRGLIKEFNRVAYDAKNKRSAIYMRYVNGDVEAKLKFLVRYDDDQNENGRLYVENFSKGKCWTKEVKGEFRKACIPDDAHAYGEYFLGLKGGYQVSGYRVSCKKVTSVLTVQPVEDGVCAPVGELVIGHMGHYAVMKEVGFTDITAGIKNATVFDVPKDCKEDWEDFDLPVDLNRDSYILAL